MRSASVGVCCARACAPESASAASVGRSRKKRRARLVNVMADSWGRRRVGRRVSRAPPPRGEVRAARGPGRDYTRGAPRRKRVIDSALALDGRARLLPGAPAARERVDVGVAHALEVVGRERRAVAAAAVEDQLGRVVRDLALDVALDDAAPDVPGAGGVAALPLVVLAHVDEARALAHPPERALDVHLAHARRGLADYLQEPFAVL